jgi:hypothetical protein
MSFCDWWVQLFPKKRVSKIKLIVFIFIFLARMGASYHVARTAGLAPNY